VARVLAQAATIGLVVVAPWLFGGVQSAVQVWLFVTVLVALGCCWLVLAIGRMSHSPLPVAVVPLLLAIGVGCLQLVPLPQTVHAAVSPVGLRLWHELLPDVAEPQPSGYGELSRTSKVRARPAEAETPPNDAKSQGTKVDDTSLGIAAHGDAYPVSLYPASTRHDLSLLVLATSVFVLGALLFRSSRAQLVLWAAVALNGAMFAFFGIVQQLTWDGRLYWSVVVKAGSPFAAFVNRNNAAGFLNLCLAGAIGLCVLAVSKRIGYRRTYHPPGDVSSGAALAHKLSLLWRSCLLFVAGLNARFLFAMAAATCIVAGILCSLSRGAWIAAAAGILLTGIAIHISRTRRARAWLFWLPALLLTFFGFGLVGWVDRGEAVKHRFSELLDEATPENGRLTHWNDGLAAATDFWRSGSGLGTYRFVYGLYQKQPHDKWFYHAENQYVEALVEMGWIGITLLLAMIGLVGVACWRLLCESPDSPSYAFGIAGVYALSSQVIHAFFDFGLYLPANMLLFALVCGAITGRAARLAAISPSQIGSQLHQVVHRLVALPPKTSLAGWTVTLLICGVVFGGLRIHSLAAAQAATVAFPVPTPSDAGTNEEVAKAIQRLDGVLEYCPDDAEGHLQLARLWVHRFRLCSLDAEQPEMQDKEHQSERWRATEAVSMHAWAHQLAATNRTVQLADFRESVPAADNLPHAARHLVMARQSCPLLPKVHLKLAELSVLVTESPADGAHLERARTLAPSDPEMLLYCGLLALQSGHTELACVCWQKVLELSPSRFQQILSLATGRMDLAENIDRLLPESPSQALKIANELAGRDVDPAVLTAVLDKALTLLDSTSLDQAERHFLLGSALALKQQNQPAIENLSRAVELCPDQAPWRYELAVVLKSEGLITEAREQARACVRMAPDNQDYEALLRELIRVGLTSRRRIRAES